MNITVTPLSTPYGAERVLSDALVAHAVLVKRRSRVTIGLEIRPLTGDG